MSEGALLLSWVAVLIVTCTAWRPPNILSGAHRPTHPLVHPLSLQRVRAARRGLAGALSLSGQGQQARGHRCR
jgi:hypothetical protein